MGWSAAQFFFEHTLCTHHWEHIPGWEGAAAAEGCCTLEAGAAAAAAVPGLPVGFVFPLMKHKWSLSDEPQSGHSFFLAAKDISTMRGACWSCLCPLWQTSISC